MVCSRVHALQEALSAGTIALEIPTRNARVQALQNLRAHMRNVIAPPVRVVGIVQRITFPAIPLAETGWFLFRPAKPNARSLPKDSPPMPRPPTGDRGWMG